MTAMFAAPLLRDLDESARRLVAEASRVRSLAVGEPLFGADDDADGLFVIEQGRVELSAVRRGDETASVIGHRGPGDVLGEEAGLGLPRTCTAVALEPTTVHEIPGALFRRGVARSGGVALAERQQRWLRRQATADLLRTQALTRDLGPDDLDIVLDAAEHIEVERGRPIFETGEIATHVFLVVSGLVQLQQTDLDGGDQVCGYLTRGDAFGDDDALAMRVRETTAVALGPTHLLRLEAGVVRTIADRNPGLLGRIRRIAASRDEAQQHAVGEVAQHTTRHVFHDLYRMQMARSLLVIDQDTCVRCGHCAWSCAATHDDGVSRLVRRGDKVLAQTVAQTVASARSLLVPNSCQHCRNPACMVDCPTGAIGRDPRGEVFIRPSLCTGCGNCAKACPWENIQMAPRGSQTPSEHAEIAVKCDLCRDADGPACVQSCPTEAIVRLDPQRDFSEVAAVLGASSSPTTPRARVRSMRATPVVMAVSLGLGLVAARLHDVGLVSSARGLGWWAGVIATVMMVGLGLHALPKRITRLWHRPSPRKKGMRAQLEAGPPALARSRVRPFVLAHLGLGAIVVPLSLLHAGFSPSGQLPGVLWSTFVAAAGLGIVGAWAYANTPPALAALEREGLLPEDFPARRQALVDRLYTQMSGRSDVVKTIAERHLVPYARATFGPVSLWWSGRTLREERARVQASIDAMLQGRGQGKLDGLDALISTVVEMRALPARRVLTGLLRGWLPVHLLASVLLMVLLAAHIVVMVKHP